MASGKKKSLTLTDPWAHWRAYDESEYCPDAPRIGEYKDDFTTLYEQLKALDRDKYTSSKASSARSSTVPGVVLSVLSGKSANNEATTHGRKTKNLSVRGTRPVHEELTMLQGKPSPTRAIVRLLCDETLPWPKSTKDAATIDMYSEYTIMDSILEEKATIRPGTLVYISLHNPQDRTCGNIVSVSYTPEPTLDELTPSPKDGFDPTCASPLKVAGTEGGNYVADTLAILDVGRLVKRVKNRIPMGVFGNGTAQTKTHFVASLLGHSGMGGHIGSVQVDGPADSYKNAFIWVGHLKNNGYMDYFDRPTTIGRETIIYAPKYLDVDADVETIYYFHDRAGFGMSWVGGPKSTVDDALMTSELEGNDFREIIAPAVKELALAGRNFILVIPEMMHSRGFGTEKGDSSRIKKYASGQAVQKGNIKKFAEVQRTKPEMPGNDDASAAIREHLNKHVYMPPIDSAQSENLSSVNRFSEREFSTFDGSFTGGNFTNFQAEVVSVLQKHIGIAGNKLNDVTLVADGLSIVSLATMSTLPESDNPFLSSPPTTINYVDSGEEYANYSPIFELSPASTLYENYLKTATNLKFNYITKYYEVLRRETNPFFQKLNRSNLWKNAYKPGHRHG